ncbi:hypothetical protein ACWDA7_42345 [Streptomyces sp. NPDC001156]
MDEVPRRIDPTTDRVSAALLLGCTPAQIGPRARCQGLTCQYGRGAKLLCPHCQAVERATTPADG